MENNMNKVLKTLLIATCLPVMGFTSNEREYIESREKCPMLYDYLIPGDTFSEEKVAQYQRHLARYTRKKYNQKTVRFSDKNEIHIVPYKELYDLKLPRIINHKQIMNDYTEWHEIKKELSNKTPNSFAVPLYEKIRTENILSLPLPKTGVKLRLFYIGEYIEYYNEIVNEINELCCNFINNNIIYSDFDRKDAFLDLMYSVLDKKVIENLEIDLLEEYKTAYERNVLPHQLPEMTLNICANGHCYLE
jgi:hypothetical protein